MNGGRVTCRWCSDSHVVLRAGKEEPCMFCDPRTFKRYAKARARAQGTPKLAAHERVRKVTELQASQMTRGRRLTW